MAITKKIENDKYEIVSDFKHIQIRERIIIEEDGVEISRSWHRRIITPNDDVSSETEEIQGLANSLWTQSVKDAWAEHLISLDN